MVGHFPIRSRRVFWSCGCTDRWRLQDGRRGGGAPQKRLAAINQFVPENPSGCGGRDETRLLVEREGMALVSAVIIVAGEVVANGQLTVVA
jgi:hypothetical protein